MRHTDGIRDDRSLKLVASNGELSPEAIRDMRVKHLIAHFTYDLFYERAMQMHPDFPDNPEFFFIALKNLAMSGKLYTFTLEAVYDAIISAVISRADERELFDGSRPLSRADADRRGKRIVNTIWGPVRKYQGASNLLVKILIRCPEFPAQPWSEYIQAVLVDRKICSYSEILINDFVSDELAEAVIAHWRVQYPLDKEKNAQLLRMFEGPPLTPEQEASEKAERKRKDDEFMNTMLYGGDFPPKRKNP